ncbi:LOW QUALITY PROTEIN: hypothetical protein NC652_019282 [Populus alba x Populus x berolinensis]|nr:LOW QUALITY PROTEIN: hypothetical protein NC652_019282 [Populus alba x Populus x berolinensis]
MGSGLGRTLSSSKAARSHLSSLTELSPSKVARSQKSSSPFQASCFTARETHPQYPFSHTYHHHCVYHSVDHAHLPPICCYDELLSRRHTVTQNQIQHRNCPLGKLKAKHLTNLCLGCKGKIKLYITFSIIAAALSAFLPFCHNNGCIIANY